jgi:hypothetical protein
MDTGWRGRRTICQRTRVQSFDAEGCLDPGGSWARGAPRRPGASRTPALGDGGRVPDCRGVLGALPGQERCAHEGARDLSSPSKRKSSSGLTHRFDHLAEEDLDGSDAVVESSARLPRESGDMESQSVATMIPVKFAPSADRLPLVPSTSAEDGYRYRLELIPQRHDGAPDQLRICAPPGWQLVAVKVTEDGRTVQRVYRRPA